MAVLPRKRRAKSADPPKDYDDDDDDDDDEDQDFGHDDGDDEEEEDDYEFVPGQEEEEADNAIEDDQVGILEGHLYFDDKEHVLHYQGDSFHLSTSLKPATTSGSIPGWNPLRDPPPSSSMATYRMKGTIQPPDNTAADDGDAPKKLPLRIFDITWTMQTNGAPPGHDSNDSNKKPAGQKKSSSDDDDAEDGKQKASPSKQPAAALFYNMVGKEVDSKANVVIQFQGGFHPPPNKKDGSNSSVPLNCQLQYVLSEATSVAAAAPAAAAAAAAPAAAGNDYGDEDDVDDDADEEMGYDELIALHQDAGMNVEDVKRQYNKHGGDDSDDGKPSPKKFKAAPKEDDDDDDDDVGF